MKKLFTLLSAVTLSAMLFAQAPQSFSYQTVIRDANWQPISNQSVSIKIEIIEDVVNGFVVHEESHSATTNDIGLVNLAIGSVITQGSQFQNINWGQHIHFIRVSVDISGGLNYIVMGTTQLRSVPYALYAETSGSMLPGPQGIAGADGLDGVDGTNGNDGVDGAPGVDGINGIDGLPGADGTDGIDGTNGTNGQDGAPGTQGVAGATGNPGTNGVNGTNGTNGAQGLPGNDGIDGIDGQDGAPGVDGTNGTNGVDGNDGAPGVDGTNGANGVDGNDGAPGVDGTNGTNGVDGAPGVDGTDGVDGYTPMFGVDYFNGADGVDGVNGTNGIDGTNGVDGAPGTTGTTGPQGPIGLTGLAGVNGEDGLDGIDSLAIADMIENAIGDSPFYDGSSNQNSNMTNDSLINGYRYFYTYFFDGKSRLFETDSTQSFANELYSVEGGNVNESLIRSLYVDEINQDLYFTTSPSLTAGATSLMKTSLSNFNPQVVYVIPCRTEYLSDFEIHPITGDFYWSVDTYWGGVNYYDVSANEVISIVSGIAGYYLTSLCINSSGDVFYAWNDQLYDTQGSSVFSLGLGNINKVIYYAPTNSFIMCSNDKVFDDQGNVLFFNQSGGGEIRDLDINYTTQRILFNTGFASVSMDIDGDNVNYNGVYPAEIQLISVLENGQTNNSTPSSFTSYVNVTNYFYTYFFDGKSRLFETDSTQSFANELYSVEGGNVNESLIRSLYVDEINQDLYFTTSPSLTAGATSLMKTSLSNFNPQVVYVIPCRTEYLSDFEIHPITGDFYWSVDTYWGGVNYYDVSANEVISIVSGIAGYYLTSLCINSSGDVFYAWNDQLYDTQGSSVFSLGLGNINKVIYYAPTNSFIMCSNDKVFDDQGNVLFFNQSGGGEIRDLDINYTTQRILFNTGFASVSMDIDGNNLNYNEVYPEEIQLIQAIE